MDRGWLKLQKNCLDPTMPPQNLVESEIEPIINSMQEDELKNDQAKRQRDGIKKAKLEGVQFGPPKKLTADQIAELGIKRRSGVSIKGLIKIYGISKATVHRYLKYLSDRNADRS